MSNLQIILKLCELLDRTQEIIREQATLLDMHGVETDGGCLARARTELLGRIEAET